MAKEHVHGVFQSVAKQYDAANNRISLGMHHAWKRALVQAAIKVVPEEGGKVLDVCCGTGDITARIAGEHSHVQVTGLDFSSEMLKVAHARTDELENVELIEGNAMELPFEDDTFNAAVVSFGLRNTPDYLQVVQEMTRVVKSGGIVACLDASVPSNAFVKPFYTFYYKIIMPTLGGGFSKRSEYKWLYQSTQDFLTKQQLKELFEEAGLKDVSVRSFMCGAAALHVGNVA
jgi:demethylmenaquinone methyltransferase / 2-methoxy-6-polyprenyl-1,4-benzoquinol methylase